MGLLDYLSPGITAATQVGGAYQGAVANAHERQQKTLLEIAGLNRQHEQDDQSRAEMNAKLMSQGVLPPGVEGPKKQNPSAGSAGTGLSGSLPGIGHDPEASEDVPQEGPTKSPEGDAPDRYVDLGGGYRYDTGSLAEAKRKAEIGDIESQGRYRDAQSKYYNNRANATPAAPSSPEELEEAYVTAGFPRSQAHLMAMAGTSGARTTTGNITRSRYPTTSISLGSRGSAATGPNGGPKPMTEAQEQSALTTRASAIMRANAAANGGMPSITYTEALQQAAASMKKGSAPAPVKAPGMPLPPGMESTFPGTPNKAQDPVLSKYTGLTP